MIRKISIDELKAGMQVVDTGLSWMQHPYLYSEPGIVASEEHVRGLKEEGYRELFIQDRDGEPFFEDKAGRERTPKPRRQRPSIPTREEYERAQALYKDSFAVIDGFLHAARLGMPIDREGPARLLEGVVENIASNPDTLVSFVTLCGTDDYTFSHSINVPVLAIVFGQYLGLGREELRQLGEAGLFHDLGKVAMPDWILNKPGRLTPEEFAVIKRHPDEGACMLEKNYPATDEVLRLIREHHERFNGSGYPDGLLGDKLGLNSLILGLADVYDALTSPRAYRVAVIPNTAMRILYAMRDKDFPKELVERFIKCLGIYPVGSFVRLTSGEVAMVCGSNAETPITPTVKIILDKDNRPCAHRVLDLSAQTAPGGEPPLAIAGPLDQALLGHGPMTYLF